MWNKALQQAASGLTETLVRTSGQRATLGRVSWTVPDGQTEEQATVTYRRDDVPVHVEQSSGGREQQTVGVKVEGDYRGILLREYEVEREDVLKVTQGAMAGTYLRVVGEPQQPGGQHWEVELEELDPGEEMREQDVLG